MCARSASQPRPLFLVPKPARQGRWDEDEDFLLLVAVHKRGPGDWAKVAEKVPCRTDAQCRERWLSYLAEGSDWSPWRPEEDDILR